MTYAFVKALDVVEVPSLAISFFLLFYSGNASFVLGPFSSTLWLACFSQLRKLINWILNAKNTSIRFDNHKNLL